MPGFSAERDGNLSVAFAGTPPGADQGDAVLPERLGQGPGQRLVVVPASADRVTGHPEEHQDRADHDDDDADRPDNGDLGDEADNEENDAENDHRGLLAAGSRRPGRGQGNIRMFIFWTMLTVA
jgi:hypothetical protein